LEELMLSGLVSVEPQLLSMIWEVHPMEREEVMAVLLM